MEKIAIPEGMIKACAETNPQNWEDIAAFVAGKMGNPERRESIHMIAAAYTGLSFLISADIPFSNPAGPFVKPPLVQATEVGAIVLEIGPRLEEAIYLPESLWEDENDNLPDLLRRLKNAVPQITASKLMGFIDVRKPMHPAERQALLVLFADKFGEKAPMEFVAATHALN